MEVPWVFGPGGSNRGGLFKLYSLGAWQCNRGE